MSFEQNFGGSEAQGDGEDGSAAPAEAGADGGSSPCDDELFWAASEKDNSPEAAAAAESANEQERQAAEAAAAQAVAAAAAERANEQERQAAEAAAAAAAERAKEQERQTAEAGAAERAKEQERQAAEAAAAEAAAAAAAAERAKEQERQAAERRRLVVQLQAAEEEEQRLIERLTSTTRRLELKKQAVADAERQADVVQAAALAVVQREEHALDALRSKLSKTTDDLAEASHTLAVVQQDSDEAGAKLRAAYRVATTAYTAVEAASVKLDAARASTERCVEDAQKASVVESAVVSSSDSLAAAADSAIDDLRTHCGEDEHCAALIAQLDLIPRVRHGQPDHDRVRIARRAAETAGTPVGKVDEGTRKAV
ncbi:hypothetical protein I4F81_003818 [Pyropia yezoensis]|uniref:Uncharacterized protein n=1 Tax=Pyropia yezoensis TaxID=2788 RepID=A0ACC3BU38_PYRYE|nr:hypothetical protein I4F81_003818 [Neopyropia yezoensis]